MISRRAVLKRAGAAGLASALPLCLPVWARGQGLAHDHSAHAAAALDTQAAPRVFDLSIGPASHTVGGRAGAAMTINGTVPGPLLRWREGEQAVLRVSNHLRETTSLHWHGLLVPNDMDGVPGVTFDGIAPGETFEYRFPIRQSGTYWYHSHSGFQEQAGVYGPIVIEPAGPERAPYEREHVIVLSDWSFMAPTRIFDVLKKEPHYFNRKTPTLFDLFREARDVGLGAALAERARWGRMRMSRADLADVTGATYTFLMNGLGPEENWTGLFTPGERVRLRIINASAMSIFDLRIPGLPMTVVSADGIDVRPVETDELRIATAETYDVIVTPGDGAYTIFAEALDRSGFARGALTPRAGLIAPVPALRPRPLRSMADMGHGDHGDHATHGNDGADADHDAHNAPAAPDPHAGHNDHGAAVIPAALQGPQLQAHDHPMGPGVDAVPDMTMNRLHEPGIGLGEDGWRVLTYAQLESALPNRDPRPPEREIELHLTGNMERFMWSFDGHKHSEAPEPIPWRYGERLRLIFVNDTMMEHPMHLHGMFMELENGAAQRPLKHTINVKPAERLSLLVTADEPGDWALHCHLLFHMEAGMMRVVRVAQTDGAAHDHHGHDDHGQQGAHEHDASSAAPDPAPPSDHSGHEGH